MIMTQGTLLRSTVLVGLLAVVAVASSGCGGSVGGAAGTKDLVLERVLLVDEGLNNIAGTGATNAFRDTRVLFEFNVDVEPSTVSDRTIRIGIPTGDGLILEAPGRFEMVPGHGNWVVFDPTYTRDNTTDVQDNPFGLQANALYVIQVPSVLDSPKYLKNLADKGIIETYNSSFTTSGDYIQTFRQPEIVSTVPAANETGVSPTSDVLLNFNEPMKPDTFILGDSVIVRDLTNNLNVLGTLRFSADARQVTFRPVFGYGKGPNDIFVRVKTTVANLPGNPIPREVRFTFTTGYDGTQPDFGDVTEPFEDNAYEDTTYPAVNPTALWDVGVTSNMLAGAFTSGTITLSQGSSTYGWMPFAWGQNHQSQYQGLYLSAEIGSSRTITSMDWYYRCLQSSAVTAMSVNIGHSQKGSFSSSTPTFNNFSDTPVAVIPNVNSYSISNTPSEGWLPMPKFTQNFKYNGSDNVVVEIFCTCGPNGQVNTVWSGLWRLITTAPVNRVVYNQPVSVGTGLSVNTYYMDTRFGYLIDISESQSKWYDTGLLSPQFLDAVLFPAIGSQPAGTTSTWEYQAAPTSLEDGSLPDLSSTTAWNSDLRKLSGFRFIRFHVVMKGNQTTGQVPIYDDLIFPFIYF
jgi:hypothetical protein